MQVKISDMRKLRSVLKTLRALAGKTVTLGIGKKGLWLRYDNDGVMCFYAVNPEFFDEYSVEKRSNITLNLDDVIAMTNKKVDEVRIEDNQLSFYNEGSLAFSYSVVFRCLEYLCEFGSNRQRNSRRQKKPMNMAYR